MDATIVLYPRQTEAQESTARAVLLAGDGGGKSYALRACLLIRCLERPGISAALLHPDLVTLREEHILGPGGVREMLQPLIDRGAVEMRPSEARFDQGSVLRWASLDRAADLRRVLELVRLDTLAIDDCHRARPEVLEPLLRRVGERVLAAAPDPESVPWLLKIFTNGHAAQIVETKPEDLPENLRGQHAETWAPQHEKHRQYLDSEVFEVLLSGTRGAGKTDLLLMDFAQHVGQGFGRAWRGAIFRQTYPQLMEIIERSHRWFTRIFPGAKYNSSKHLWTFEGGEQLRFCYAMSAVDYWQYHGWEIPFLGFDELCTWPDLDLYVKLMSCCRSSHPGVPKKVRATANPYGVGHVQVKQRFVDPAPASTTIHESYKDPLTGEAKTRDRLRISVSIRENLKLMEADPDYLGRLEIQGEAQRRAWIEEDWDVEAGGMFEDVWSKAVHVLEPFDIPKDWRIDRAFDWGSAKPYSVGWWAESADKLVLTLDGRERVFPRGSLFRIAEAYGWNGKPNEGVNATNSEIAERIRSAEAVSPLLKAQRVRPGPADSAIYAVTDGKSIASEMERCGVRWLPAAKGPGSRVAGWQAIRDRLKAGLAERPEEPGLFTFSTCREGFLRTFPVAPRSPKNPDDVDTAAEDHCLAGDTLVLTNKGAAAISVLVGTEGLVVGPDGEFHPYRACRKTRSAAEAVRLTFSDGSHVTCTPDHLFLTTEGWIPAADVIRYSLCGLRQSSESSAPNARSFSESATTCAARTFSERASAFIAWCSSTSAGRSRRALTSTTRTATAPTTSPPTSLSWIGRVTAAFMRIICRARSPRRLGRRLGFGMEATLAGSGIASNTGGIALRRSSLESRKSAPIAASSSRVTVDQGSAPTTARARLGALAKSITSRRYAPAVVARSDAADTTRPLRAATSAQRLTVVSVEPAGRADVYCLSVPGVGAFALANGAIVHNCLDETRYRCMGVSFSSGMVKM